MSVENQGQPLITPESSSSPLLGEQTKSLEDKRSAPVAAHVLQNARQRMTLIQSYVVDRYFVSTIYRQSSAMLDPSWYYETVVFEWDYTTKKTGKMLDQRDSGISRDCALRDHSDVCAALVFSGKGPTVQ